MSWDQVPFLGSWNDPTVFKAPAKPSDSVDNARLMTGAWAGQRVGFEADVQDWNVSPAAVLEILATRRRCVAKIERTAGIVFTNQRVEEPTPGTGFLVAPNILLTNHHVLNSKEMAEGSTAIFNFEAPMGQLIDEDKTTGSSSIRLKFDPERLFITSRASSRGLDYTFIWVEGDTEQFGYIPLGRGFYKAKHTEPTFVIHHSLGKQKRVSLDDTEVLGDNQNFLLYAADTRNSSSGSPVFNKHGALTALHHRSICIADFRSEFPNVSDVLNDGRRTPCLNEGIKISAIISHLEYRSQQAGDIARMAKDILAQTREVDTVTGLFGVLGRSTDARSDLEAVQDLRSNTDQDIDIGYWNAPWLSQQEPLQKQIDTLAAFIADINPDVWVFGEVRPATIGALETRLRERFGQQYRSMMAEQMLGEDDTGSAIIWHETRVEGAALVWPPEIDRLWQTDGVNYPGLPEGRIFSKVPGLFRMKLRANGASIRLIAPPAGMTRADTVERRLLSRLLAYAAETMNRPDGTDDWFIPGQAQDVPGFTTHVIREDRGNTLTYLRQDNSPFARLYLSANLSPMGDETDFIAQPDHRSMKKFVPDESEHPPIAMRLSVKRTSAIDAEVNAAKLFDKMVANAAGSSTASSVAASLPKSSNEHFETGLSFEYQGLKKPDFLKRNAAAFRHLLKQANDRLRNQYGSEFRAVTDEDLWLVVYAEAGFNNGAVDPSARHSEGERGLLPLPSNITDWNGSDAPRWDQLMPLDVNLFHYAVYIGQLKNKPVRNTTAGTLYRDLFASPGISGDPMREAKLVAAIIHGYFYAGNYGGAAVPYQRLLNGFALDHPINVIMSDTAYVHAGTSILVNRQRNIDAAVRDFQAF